VPASITCPDIIIFQFYAAAVVSLTINFKADLLSFSFLFRHSSFVIVTIQLQVEIIEMDAEHLHLIAAAINTLKWANKILAVED
jgi:hypothetical protein